MFINSQNGLQSRQIPYESNYEYHPDMTNTEKVEVFESLQKHIFEEYNNINNPNYETQSNNGYQYFSSPASLESSNFDPNIHYNIEYIPNYQQVDNSNYNHPQNNKYNYQQIENTNYGYQYNDRYNNNYQNNVNSNSEQYDPKSSSLGNRVYLPDLPPYTELQNFQTLPVSSSFSDYLPDANTAISIGTAITAAGTAACVTGIGALACPVALVAAGLTGAFVIGKAITSILFKRDILPSSNYPSDRNIGYSAEFDWVDGHFIVYEEQSLVKRYNQEISQEIAEVLNENLKYPEEKPLKISTYNKNDTIIIEAEYMDKSNNGILNSHAFNSSLLENDKNFEEIWSLYFHFKPEDFEAYSKSPKNLESLISEQTLVESINDYILSSNVRSACTKIPTIDGRVISVQIDVNQEQKNLDLCF